MAYLSLFNTQNKCKINLLEMVIQKVNPKNHTYAVFNLYKRPMKQMKLFIVSALSAIRPRAHGRKALSAVHRCSIPAINNSHFLKTALAVGR